MKKIARVLVMIIGFAYAFSCHAQTSYSVVQIPYAPYSFTAGATLAMDDEFSPVFPIGFNFIFFGTSYSSLVISGNGDTKVGGCTTTAVASATNANKVSIYPNPATNELTITTGNSAYSSLTITNSIGQEMLAQPISNATTKVNIAALAAGVYYVEAKGDSGSKILKFVKF